MAGKIDEPAVDASVDLESGDVTPQAVQEGRRVQAAGSARAARKRLLDAARDRPCARARAVVKPKVSTDELAKEYPAILIVDRAELHAHALQEPQAGEDLRRSRSARSAWRRRPGSTTSRTRRSTPPGRAELRLGGARGPRQGRPGGAPENPLKARWLGIFDGAGIHGTDAVGSIGSAASHGCIRMLIPDVIELYDQVPVGAPVYIA